MTDSKDINLDTTHVSGSIFRLELHTVAEILNILGEQVGWDRIITYTEDFDKITKMAIAKREKIQVDLIPQGPIHDLTDMSVDHITARLEIRPIGQILLILYRYCGVRSILAYCKRKVAPETKKKSSK
jgi:hypothetical protein